MRHLQFIFFFFSVLITKTYVYMIHARVLYYLSCCNLNHLGGHIRGSCCAEWRIRTDIHANDFSSMEEVSFDWNSAFAWFGVPYAYRMVLRPCINNLSCLATALNSVAKIKHDPGDDNDDNDETNKAVDAFLPSGVNPPQVTEASCPANTCIHCPVEALNIHAL